jgi:hypothetical protein
LGVQELVWPLVQHALVCHLASPNEACTFLANTGQMVRCKFRGIIFRIAPLCPLTPCCACPLFWYHKPNAPFHPNQTQPSTPAQCKVQFLDHPAATRTGDPNAGLSVHSNSAPTLAHVRLNGSSNLLCLHIGHCPFEESCLIHSTIQCYIPSAPVPASHNSNSTNHMKVMSAFARDYSAWSAIKRGRTRVEEHTQAAIISWILARWTCAIEVYLADSADVVVGDIPSPCRYRVPLPDLDLHLEILSYANI